MIYLAGSVFVIWLSTLYFLAGRSRKEIRLALDNRAPDATSFDFRRFGFWRLARDIDPAGLNEAGRVHRERAIRTERIMLWMIGAFLLAVP